MELRWALLLDNVGLEDSNTNWLEHVLDMQSVEGEGYGLSQAINKK